MKVDRDKFMEQGFLILRNVIPPDKLDAMRASCEAILDRRKAVWAAERGPDDPPGGQHDMIRQPRVYMEEPGLIDEETANVVEDFWVADETLDYRFPASLQSPAQRHQDDDDVQPRA